MRQVFFSFHYSHDVWRASQVRNMRNVDRYNGPLKLDTELRQIKILNFVV